MRMNDRISQVIQAVQDAHRDGMLIDLKLYGATGGKVIGVLQRLMQLLPENECYVEIGVFQGMSLLSTAKAAPGIKAFGIDDFSQFDKDGKNRQLIEERKIKAGINNAFLINMDFEDALNDLGRHLNGRKIGLFFIDGPHDYRSQIVCFLLAKKYLSEEAIILVDNSNYNHVRQANQDFLMSHPEYKMIFEAYSRSHPANLKGAELDEAWKGWLDGINIIVRDPQDRLRPMYPETIRDRSLFFNDHKIHPMRNSELAWRAAKLAAVLKPFRPYYFFGFLYKLIVEVRKRKRSEIQPFLFINSYSENLPKFNLNKSAQEIENRSVKI